MRRKGHYVYEKVPRTRAYFDKRDVKKYGLYSDKTRQYSYLDLDKLDARNNARIYERNEFMISRYVSDGVDFTPSVWGLVIAVLFLLALCFLFKGLNDNSSIFDTSLSLADCVCNFGSRFKEIVSQGFNSSIDPNTFSGQVNVALGGWLDDQLNNTWFNQILSIISFLIKFVWIFVRFIIDCLGCIFA